MRPSIVRAGEYIIGPAMQLQVYHHHDQPHSLIGP